jgi:hypothetical protein
MTDDGGVVTPAKGADVQALCGTVISATLFTDVKQDAEDFARPPKI